MADNYECVTALQSLPIEHVKPWHRLALNAAGFEFEEGSEGVYMYAPAECGTRGIDIDIADVEGFLEDTGLVAYATESFVKDFIALAGDKGQVDWSEVAQLMLKDMPPEVPHMDFQAAYWCSKSRSGEFGGFSLRITRDAIHAMSTSELFDQLDAKASRVVTRPGMGR